MLFKPFPPNKESSSDDDDDNFEYPNPKCFEPFQLVFARKYKNQLWPAAIIGPGQLIPGFRVHFFRSKDVLDVPRQNILMYFENMLESQISFRRNGRFKRGILRNIQMSERTIKPKFLIEDRKGVFFEVPFFEVFLNKKQADEVLSEEFKVLKKKKSTSEIFNPPQ